ncbi:MAG: hypothetical protein U0746_06220 [Gemmataceae bacterium]
MRNRRTTATSDWREVLRRRLPLFGHRNWIAVVDSAYPLQTRAGIETLATGADHLEVVRLVMEEIGRQPHVRPAVYLDAELPLVPEADAPGIDIYRDRLAKQLAERHSTSMPHAEIIARLDAAGALFAVLVLKTTLAIPYTSVFIELDCGYWPSEAEQRLRNAGRSKRRRTTPIRS